MNSFHLWITNEEIPPQNRNIWTDIIRRSYKTIFAMENKRKLPQGTTNGRKKAKADLSKESILGEVRKLKLYTDEDRYYKEVQTNIGPLRLNWARPTGV